MRSKVLLGIVTTCLGLTLGYCATNTSTIPPSSDVFKDRTALDPATQVTRPPSAIPGVISTTPSRPLRGSSSVDPAENPYPPDELIGAWKEPYYPFLKDEPQNASISVGNTSHGYIINAKPLTLPAREYAVLHRQFQRHLLYGSDEMLDLLETTAKRFYARHKRVMWIGNIGRRGGGDIRYSVSHNSGRDVDLAFAYTDPSEQPVDPPDLLHVDSNGTSLQYGGAYRFDTRRTWTIVRELLSHPKVQVQYIFISNPLKEMLIRHAQRIGERPSLIEKARAVVMQPGGGAAPHNDHLHIRIHCGKRDVEGGCQNTGTALAGTDLFTNARTRRAREVSRFLTDADPEQRARAVERLVILRSVAHIEHIAKLLQDPSPRARKSSAKALGTLGNPEHSSALIAQFRRDDDPSVMISILQALRSLGGRGAGRFLAEIIQDPTSETHQAGPLPLSLTTPYTPVLVPEFYEGPWSDDPALQVAVDLPRFSGQKLPLDGRLHNVRLAAIEAAANLERPEPVPALIEVLHHDDPLMRARAARALRRLTNHTFGYSWADPSLSTEARKRGVGDWTKWYGRFSKQTRSNWVAAGFRVRGYKVQKCSEKYIWGIAKAILDRNDHVSYNAQRTLMALTDHTPKSLAWPKGDACWHWTRWLNKNRRRFKLSKRPPSLARFDP